LIKSSFFKKQCPKKGIDKFPFALAYIPVSSIFAFIFDELPLKFYGPPEIVYDTEASGGLGPQSVNICDNRALHCLETRDNSDIDIESKTT
jgi:hypothetical protein